LPIEDDKGNCVFLPPIKRMTLNQDSIQVVAYDDDSPKNAGLAASYALIGMSQFAPQQGVSTIGTAASPTALCNYTRGAGLSGIFYRDPSVFLQEHLCFCPTPSSPGTNLFDPNALAQGDYYHICPCDTGSHESGGLCCQGHFDRCHGGCVDTGTDPSHCGACDNACDSDETCVNGVCLIKPVNPPFHGNVKFYA